MRFTRCWLISPLLAATLAFAQTLDEPQVTFLATDPAPNVQLMHNERFYVRFAVKSAAPVAVMINAYTKGNPVFADMGSSAVNFLPAGGGVAVAYFFYWGVMSRHIDEVRLTVSAPAAPSKDKEFALPVNLTLTTKDAAGQPRPTASWVLQWQQGGSARRKLAPHVENTPELNPAAVLAGIAILASIFVLARNLMLRSRHKTDHNSAIK